MVVHSPRDPELATSAAYLRLTGHTQQEAADAIGVDRVTVARWEASEWWAEYSTIARERWLAGMAAKSRRIVEDGMETDPRLAMTVLERLEPALNPKAALEVSGGEKPVAIEITRRVVDR